MKYVEFSISMVGAQSRLEKTERQAGTNLMVIIFILILFILVVIMIL